MNGEPEPDWYVDWPLQDGCLQVLVTAPDEYNAEIRAHMKLVTQYPQLEALMLNRPRVRRVAQA